MEQKRRFKMPHNYVVVFCIVILAAVLTWVIPAGEFERDGKYVIPGTYHSVEADPVGPIGVFYAVEQGFVQTADIIFFIMFAYGFVHMLLKNGSFDALMGALIRRTAHFDDRIIFVIIMIVFGILGATMGMAEETYGMYPIFIGIGAALGYDAIVGASIVYIGVQTGFASAILNPFTLGVANGISGITTSPQMFIYRIVCFVVFEGVGILYVLRYAGRIKKDPSKGLLYGTEYQNMGKDKSKEEMVAAKMTSRHAICGIIFVAVIGLMIWGVLAKGWYIDELSTLFFIAMVVAGLAGGFGPSQIASEFIEASKSMVRGAFIVGVSRAIMITMQNGLIIDSVLYYLSSALNGMSGVIAAMLQVIVQNIINVFIPSGSGQASAVMPIMAPLSDLLGVSRQTANLAFTFGDGYSNMIIPTGIFTISGLIGLPVDKWFKWISKLFIIFFCLELVMITGAVLLGL
ncbi:MAG: YfcC family protein [Firmicutes bacterium]|nr:YfcC family protein [Bacillota bacterium]